VSTSAYYLAWLGGGLLAIAAASAVFAWRQSAAARRAVQAVELLDALARYADWFGAQRHAVCFQAPVARHAPGLDAIAAMCRAWPEPFRSGAQSLLNVHGRLDELLSSPDLRRADDPEAPLEAGHDASFMALWREHCEIVRGLELYLADVAGGTPALTGITLPS
jgi:hypothetical protein